MNSLLVQKSLCRKRTNRISMICWGVYCLAVFAISGWFGWEPPKAGWGLYVAAGFPALPVGVGIFVVGRGIIGETDEFLRMLLVKAMLIGTGVTMFVCTGWGFLAQYAHVWAPPLYLVFPLWWGCVGVAMPLVNRRYR